MTLMKANVPEQYRRAMRLAVGLALPCVLGLGVLGSELPRRPEFTQACLWCAITVAVVNAPLLGKTARTGMERCLGTVLGGVTGYLVFQIGELFWNEQTDGTVLTVGAIVAAVVSILVGHKLKLDASARLFIITFLLVIFGADRGSDAAALAWNRVCGILSGVMLIIILSILIFPKSASMECINNIEKALEGLHELNALAWSSYISGPEFEELDLKPVGAWKRAVSKSGYVPLPAADDIEAQESCRGTGLSPHEEAAAARAAAEDAFEMHVLTSVAQTGFKLVENMELADAEWHLFTYDRRPVFVPDLPLCLKRPTSMPLEDLGEVGNAIRRVSRLLAQLINTMAYGFRAELQQMLGTQYPDDMLRSLAVSCQAVTEELVRGFPESEAVAPGPLMAFVSKVAGLVSSSDHQRRQIIQALKRYRSQRPDRLGWDRLVDAMLRQPADAGGGGGIAVAQSAPPAITSPLLQAVEADQSFMGAGAKKKGMPGGWGGLSAGFRANQRAGLAPDRGSRSMPLGGRAQSLQAPRLPPARLESVKERAELGDDDGARSPSGPEFLAAAGEGGAVSIEDGAAAGPGTDAEEAQARPPAGAIGSSGGNSRPHSAQSTAESKKDEDDAGISSSGPSLLFQLSMPNIGLRTKSLLAMGRQAFDAAPGLAALTRPDHGERSSLTAPLLPAASDAAAASASGAPAAMPPQSQPSTVALEESPRKPTARFTSDDLGRMGSSATARSGGALGRSSVVSAGGGGAGGGAASSAAESTAIGRTALRAHALADASPGLSALLAPVSGLGGRAGGPTSRDLAALGALPGDPQLHVFLFPETPEGRVAQVRWYSFQYLLEELAEELSALQHALNDVLAKLP